MDLERAIGVLRPRSAWEAVDFGWLLARRLARSLWSAWFLVAAPLALALLATNWGRPWVAVGMLWLLRPILDMPVLFVLSRGLFGQPTGPEALLPELRAVLGAQLAARLTVWRLDLQRSYRLPVVGLEGLRGRHRRDRVRVLGRRHATEAGELALVCLGLEAVVMLGLLGLVFLGLPPHLHPDWPTFFEDGLWSEPRWGRLVFLGQVVSMTVVQPLYVAGGFGLYLNRRTVLEGWDIQLAFGRLAARASQSAGVVLALMLAWVGVGLAMPQVAVAEEGELLWGAEFGEGFEDIDRAPLIPPDQVLGATPGDPQAEVEAILAHPDFGRTETETHWRRRETAEEWTLDLGFFGAILAQAAEVLLWLVALVALGVLVTWLLRSAQVLSDGGSAPRVLPTELLGFDLRPESLPDDVPAAARALLAAGDRIGALSLLYRAALARLVHGFALELDPGATEADCVWAVAGSGGPSRWFEEVTRAWQSEAYAHRALSAATIGELIDGWAGALQDVPSGEGAS
jgi:hypothetical protein